MKKKDKKLASNGKISMLQGEYKARFEPRMICFSCSYFRFNIRFNIRE